MINLEKLREERRQLAHRRRRIIMNNDGFDFRPTRWNLGVLPNSAEEFLAMRTTSLAGTHVDTVSYGVLPCGFDGGNHRSKVCDVLRRDGTGVTPAPEGWDDPDILMEGRDSLEIITEFCHQNELEAWASFRMSAVRDLWPLKERKPWEGEHPERWMADPLDIGGGFEEKAFLVSEAALEHPQRWVDRGSFSLFHAMDYGLEEVREKMFVIIADICGRYDVDGIELDLLRAPIYFRANAEGNPDAGAENRDKMTAFLRRIRQMTEDVGCRRKRPLLIAIRVPDDVETAFALGLDTSLWLEESLLDILIAGASWRFRPWKEIVTLGHKYGVPVYANPTEGGMSPEAYRGRTLAAWASGVDGIYTFNETEPDSLAWNELGDPEKLLELDRMTPVENARIERHEMSHINRLPGVSRFLARAPRLPLSLPTGEEKSFEFTAAEDGARVAASTTPHVSLHVQFHNLEDGDEITVVLNGNPLEFEETLRDCPRPGWVIFQPDPSSLRWGDNLLALTVTGRDPEAGGPLALADMQLHVTAEPGEFRREVREIPEPSAQAGYIEKAAFLITESEILPPPQKMNAQRQWLLDELEFARPRSPVARTMLESFSDYPPDPVEKPLPGWKSLAVVFDANETGARCARELMNAFFAKVAPQFIDGELGLYAGELAGTATLAALVVRSRSPENLEHIARQFGRDAQVKGLLPFPVRFLRAEDDGHLIPRVFAIVFRGTLRDGFFTHAPGCWKENVRGVHGVQNGRGFTKG